MSRLFRHTDDNDFDISEFSLYSLISCCFRKKTISNKKKKELIDSYEILLELEKKKLENCLASYNFILEKINKLKEE